MDSDQLPRFQTYDTDSASQGIELTEFHRAFSFQRVYIDHLNRRSLSNFDERGGLSIFHSLESTKESVARGLANASARGFTYPSTSRGNLLNVSGLLSARPNVNENHSDRVVHESKSISCL